MRPTRALSPTFEYPEGNRLIFVQGNSLKGYFTALNEPPTDLLEKANIEHLIKKTAQKYGVSSWLMIELARIESGFLKHPFGDNYMTKGLFHYWDDTFYHFAEVYEIENPNTWEIDQQIELTALLIRDGYGPNFWYNSYKKLGLIN